METRFAYQPELWRDLYVMLGTYSVFRGILNTGGYLLGLAGGVILIEWLTWGLYLVTASFIVFLVSAVSNAWALMTVIGEAKRIRK
jgi:hypothetical protein